MGDSDLHAQSEMTEVFFDAIEYDDMETLQKFVEQCKDVQNTYGSRPLHVCIENDKLECLNFLLENKADASLTNDDGKAPLHVASEEGRAEFADALIKGGADVNGRAANGNTPLHSAVYRSQVEVSTLLVTNKADVNLQNDEDDTPLHFASWRGNQETATLLTSNGARSDIVNKEGKTALATAQENELPEEFLALLNASDAAPVEAASADGVEDVKGEEAPAPSTSDDVPSVELTAEELKRLQAEKPKLMLDNEKYLRDHPELTGMLQEFLTEMLETRPDDFVQAAVDFFVNKQQ